MSQQMQAYGAYHRDPRNRLTHFVGVPLVVFSTFIPLGWFRFVHADIPLTGATLFYLAVLVYYLRLDWRMALLQAPASGLLLYLADRVSLLPFKTSALVFAVTFVGGWTIQFIGHVFEGRRPALVDNFFQIFNAPLFLTVEAAALLNRRSRTASMWRSY